MPPRQSAKDEVDAPPQVSHSATATDELKVLKNRPKASKLRQQKLPAWQPILTSLTAIPVVFAIGIAFIPIGVLVLLSAKSVNEHAIDYGVKCNGNTHCELNFTLSDSYDGDVFFYYSLHNFFQNHRRYVKSRSDKQLLGNVKDVRDCDPLDYLNTDKGKLPIAPCGAIANSMFNDTFVVKDSKGKVVPLTINGVVWEVDRNVRFKNPEGQDLCEAFAGTVKPPNWRKRPCELDPKNPSNNGFQNVDFIVWMRTAGLPSFKKLYRKLARNESDYSKGLPKGDYTLVVENNYPVDSFDGKKSFIISTTSWTGGRNMFLGIAYIVIGSVCIILGAIFTGIHLKFGHSFAEMANISTTSR